MEIYGPSKNKVITLRSENRAYFDRLVSRSEYSEEEITLALDSITKANEGLQQLLSKLYDLLVWEDGEEMGHMVGFASDNHKELSAKLCQVDYISPNMSENNHLNCFPVRKWQKEVKQLKAEMTRLQKFASKL
jgi:hypothetical protein